MNWQTLEASQLGLHDKTQLKKTTKMTTITKIKKKKMGEKKQKKDVVK